MRYLVIVVVVAVFVLVGCDATKQVVGPVNGGGLKDVGSDEQGGGFWLAEEIESYVFPAALQLRMLAGCGVTQVSTTSHRIMGVTVGGRIGEWEVCTYKDALFSLGMHRPDIGKRVGRLSVGDSMVINVKDDVTMGVARVAVVAASNAVFGFVIDDVVAASVDSSGLFECRVDSGSAFIAWEHGAMISGGRNIMPITEAHDAPQCEIKGEWMNDWMEYQAEKWGESAAHICRRVKRDCRLAFLPENSSDWSVDVDILGGLDIGKTAAVVGEGGSSMVVVRVGLGYWIVDIASSAGYFKDA